LNRVGSPRTLSDNGEVIPATPRRSAAIVQPDLELPPLPRTDPITSLPILILFPHSRCNCRCLMCDIWRVSTKTEIAPTDVARWTDEWRRLGVRRVVLSGGEALLHSRLWELCDHLRAADIAITILTTGLRLKQQAAELARRCDDVIVSLDGPQTVHDHIRNVPRAYERLAEGVAELKRIDRGISVSGRCTVQRSNFDSLRATVDSARALGLNRISFLAADVSSQAFNRADAWNGERIGSVMLERQDLPRLAKELDALEVEHAADFASGYIAESPGKLRRVLLRYYKALLGEGDFAANTCNAPWVSSVIEADGTVRPCFFQPALGNLYETGSLDSIINSPEAIAWRKGLDVRRNAICRRCVCTLSLRETADDPVLRNG
jgi:MoaA/NifB/PqqE/SkfB family radical SAM enzyme